MPYADVKTTNELILAKQNVLPFQRRNGISSLIAEKEISSSYCGAKQNANFRHIIIIIVMEKKTILNNERRESFT